MEQDMGKKICLSNPGFNVLFRIGVCLLVLAAGIAGMFKLADLKTPPREKQVREEALQVEVMRVTPEDVPVVLTGYGEVAPLDVVSIAPEVSGRIMHVHTDLEPGEIIAADETLFVIDPVNYKAALQEAESAVSQARARIKRLRKQLDIDRARLKTLKRNTNLAQAEFQRLKTLFEKEKVGTRSGVEQAEQAANLAADQYDQLASAVDLLPIQIRESESALGSAQAGLQVARANLQRCTVQTAFQARIKSVDLEKGQYVTPGQPVLTLADDSVLEVQVPLDSREARKWLQFKPGGAEEKTGWFKGIKQVQCSVRWTEDTQAHLWDGRLHRVVRFDPQTRTLKLAVRVKGDDPEHSGEGRFPLVEGMFCAVSIPGKTLHNVFRLPRSAVGFDGTVFTAVDQRLKTVQVDLLKSRPGEAIVANGLAPGDLVVTTRLIDPLENSLLRYSEPGKGSES